MKPIKSSRLKIIQKQNRAEYIIIKIIIKSVIQHYDSFHLRVLMTQGLLICHKMKTLLLIGCWGGSEAALSSLVHTGAPESTTGPLKCNSVLKLLQTSGVCQVCVRRVSGVSLLCDDAGPHAGAAHCDPLRPQQEAVPPPELPPSSLTGPLDSAAGGKINTHKYRRDRSIRSEETRTHDEKLILNIFTWINIYRARRKVQNNIF